LFYGVKIYESGINLNGKLSWFLKDLKDKKTVEFEHNNIYEDGIEGILTDINKEIPMSENLYVSDNFGLKFNSDGEITSFNTYLYGKNEKDEVESYLISYDSSHSRNITVYLRGYVNADYNEDKSLEPLIKTMKVIHLKDTINAWNEKQYGILYYGKRNWGYNTEGLVYVDTKGNTMFDSSASSEIVGYTVSVYVPGKESVYTPVRYNLVEDLDSIKRGDSLKEDKDKKNSKKSSNDTDEFYLSDQIGYRLEVTGAAAGSRSYSLNGTSNGGATWESINEDPFSGKVGAAAGITFLDKRLGFLCLSHSGGGNGELYRTEDGGVTFKKVDFPEMKVTLNGGATYNPFDFPGMPYEKDGSLNILVGQGSDGDYNGGTKALYESKDSGNTWSYIKEAKTE
jgi:hypothetical protein